MGPTWTEDTLGVPMLQSEKLLRTELITRNNHEVKSDLTVSFIDCFETLYLLLKTLIAIKSQGHIAIHTLVFSF